MSKVKSIKSAVKEVLSGSYSYLQVKKRNSLTNDELMDVQIQVLGLSQFGIKVTDTEKLDIWLTKWADQRASWR